MTAVVAAILTKRQDPPEHAGPLRDLVESLLAKDPAARPDARSAVAALAAATAPAAGRPQFRNVGRWRATTFRKFRRTGRRPR